MRGPDSLPREVSFDEGWPNEAEPILAIACPCCKGEGHEDHRGCGMGLEMFLSEDRAARPWHPILNTELAEWPGCWICFDSGVVPVNPATEERE